MEDVARLGAQATVETEEAMSDKSCTRPFALRLTGVAGTGT